MSGRQPKPHRKHTAVRVDAPTLTRLEALRSRFSTAWRDATMSDILRAALVVGLTEMERVHLGRRAGPRAARR